MKAFEYASPETVADAVTLLSAEGSAGLAGGTDMINRMKEYVSSPARVVYLKSVAELGSITDGPDGGLTLGANVRLADILASEAIAQKYPALRQAALEVGTPQIRNMATLGGNLLQRPRCWYYRNGYGLLGGKKEGTSLVRELEGKYAPIDVGPDEGGHIVRRGDNRYAAIFMTEGDALFVSPSSLAPALIALGATATSISAAGEKTAEVESLYQVPKVEGDRELTLPVDTLLTKVTIPAPKGKNATYEVRWKQSHDWPLALCSVCLEMDGETVKAARVVLGSVAPVPLICGPAAESITGKPITPETAAAAGAAAVASAKPLSMNAYKVQLTKVAVERALLAAVGNRTWEA